MTQQQQQTLDALMGFKLDDMGAALKFSDRLARENGWSLPYTMRVLKEYKRFIFLCRVLPNGATPSDQVDQAWHLHMIYTRSYWQDMCRDILKCDLHHGPTKGGGKERSRFNDQYTNTMNGYRTFFGEEPPSDIWPSNKDRFSDIDFQRVNKRTHWVIPKLRVPRIWPFFAALLAPLFAIAHDKKADGDDGWQLILLIIIVLIVIVVIAASSKGGRGGSSSSSGCGGCCGGGCGGGCGGCGD